MILQPYPQRTRRLRLPLCQPYLSGGESVVHVIDDELFHSETTLTVAAGASGKADITYPVTAIKFAGGGSNATNKVSIDIVAAKVPKAVDTT